MRPSKDYLALHPSLWQTTSFFFFIPIPSSFGLLPPRQLYKATDSITVNYYLIVSTNHLDGCVLLPEAAAPGALEGSLVG